MTQLWDEQNEMPSFAAGFVFVNQISLILKQIVVLSFFSPGEPVDSFHKSD